MLSILMLENIHFLLSTVMMKYDEGRRRKKIILHWIEAWNIKELIDYADDAELIIKIQWNSKKKLRTILIIYARKFPSIIIFFRPLSQFSLARIFFIFSWCTSILETKASRYFLDEQIFLWVFVSLWVMKWTNKSINFSSTYNSNSRDALTSREKNNFSIASNMECGTWGKRL